MDSLFIAKLRGKQKGAPHHTIHKHQQILEKIASTKKETLVQLGLLNKSRAHTHRKT